MGVYSRAFIKGGVRSLDHGSYYGVNIKVFP